MIITFSSSAQPEAGPLVVGATGDGKLLPAARRVDRETGGALSRAIEASRFKGEKAQSLTLLAPAGIKASRVVVMGLGKAEEFNELAAQELGGTAYGAISSHGDKDAMIAIDALRDSPLNASELASHIAYGARLGSYRFDKYRTKEKDEDKPSLRTLSVFTRSTAAATKAFDGLDKIADGVFFTRDLVSEPPNVIYPISLAREANRLSELGVKVRTLDEEQMEAMGMGALLGVAQGSANKPRLVVAQWNGAPKGADPAPIAFLGKGVTFDTGGISIKPAGGMEDMKWDMAGSGVVLGLMKALAGRKARVNAVGLVGLVENMPSGTAQRPGDVVHTMSGQTVEVINTDAEGRLVLADVMWYCQEEFKPHTMIDLATLTGAIIVSLGNENAGLFANDEGIVERLVAAGKAVGEPVWHMPLGKGYDKLLDSQIADMKNIGNRWGGAITAAQFLQRFVKDGTSWAHLDIAGVTWSSKSTPTVPKGGTAFGVRLLDRLVADYYEP